MGAQIVHSHATIPLYGTQVCTTLFCCTVGAPMLVLACVYCLTPLYGSGAFLKKLGAPFSRDPPPPGG